MSRITWVLPSLGLSGGVRVASVYAQKLHERGHCVQVVAPSHNTPSLPRKVRSLVRGRGWPQTSTEREDHFVPLSVPVKILDTHRPVSAADVPDADVIVATWWQTAQWVAEMPASKGKPLYFVQHDESRLAGQPMEEVRATWSLPMDKICVAQWLADLVASETGHATVSIPNSVDAEVFFAEPRERRDPPVVGTMISREPWKGSDIVLEAVRLAAREVPGLTLNAFGELIPEGEWALDEGWKYERRPSPERMRNIYSGCDAWLFGSRFEGFGLPILEAMACRTPVIGAPAGAAPELLTDGRGVLVGEEDPAAMSRAIVDLLTGPPDSWRAMSDAAYATAAGYTWDDAVDRFENEIERAMKDDSARVEQPQP